MENVYLKLLAKAILPPLFLILFIALFVYLFPRKKTKIRSLKRFGELADEYQKYENRGSSLFIIFAFLFTYPIFVLLQAISNYFYSMVQNKGIFVGTETIAWVITAFFISFILGGVCSQIVLLKQLKERWEEYIKFQDLKYKFNTIKGGKCLAITSTILTLILTISLLDSYSSFNEKEVRINHFLGFGTTHYRYKDIVKIEAIKVIKKRENTSKEVKYFRIIFNDGYTWSSVDSGFNDYKKDSKIIALIKKKTRIDIHYIKKQPSHQTHPQ